MLQLWWLILCNRTATASLIIERGLVSKGSCCDDGRYIKTERFGCDNFWYYCSSMHEYTLKEWIKFGRYGLTAPLTTEHLGKCRYYPDKRICDVPRDCMIVSNMNSSDGQAICGEVPKVNIF